MRRIFTILFAFTSILLCAETSFTVTYNFNSDLNATISKPAVLSADAAEVGGTKLTVIGLVDDNGTNALKMQVVNNNSTNYVFTFAKFNLRPQAGYIIKVSSIKVKQRSSKAGEPNKSQTYLYRIGCAFNGAQPVMADINQSTANTLFYDTYQSSSFSPHANFATASGDNYITAQLTARGASTSNDIFDWYIDEVEITGTYVKILDLPDFAVDYSFVNASIAPTISNSTNLTASDVSFNSNTHEVMDGLFWLKTNANTNTIGYGLMGMRFDITPNPDYEILLSNYQITHAGSGVAGSSRANRIGIFRDVSRSADGVLAGNVDFTSYTGTDMYGTVVAASDFKTDVVEDLFAFDSKHFFTISFNRTGPEAEQYWTVKNININGWVIPKGRAQLLKILIIGQNTLLSAPVGTAPGEYPQVALDDFQNILSAANDSLLDLNVSQNSIDSLTNLIAFEVDNFALKANNRVATVTVNTAQGHALIEGMSGYNSRLADSGWSFKNKEWQQAMNTLSAGWLRYMSGTRNNGFNMNIGLYEVEDLDQLFENGEESSGNSVCHRWVEAKGPQTVYDLYQGLGNVNARLVVTWSGFIGEPWEAALFAKFCKDNHIEVDLWQFVNEPYFHVPNRHSYFWNDGEDYARKMHPIADSIKTYFPHAILAPNSSWDNAADNFSKAIANYQPRFYNAFSKHTYAAYNTDGNFPHSEGIKQLVGGVYYTGTQAHPLIEATYGKDIPVYVTESGTWNTATKDLIMSGIYMSEYILRMAAHDNTKLIAKHSINSAAKPVNNHSSAINNAYNQGVVLPNVDNLVCGIELTIEGKGQRIINAGINRSDFAYHTTITGDVSVEANNKNTSVKQVPALFGGVYKGTNGNRYLLITNKSDVPHKLDIQGISLPDSVLNTYISSLSPYTTNDKLFEQTKYIQTNNLVVEPYSINRIEWFNGEVVPSALRIYDVKISDAAVNLKWWTKENADSYVVKYGISPDNLDKTIEFAGSATNAGQIDDLSAGLTYYFAVAGKNSAGTGEFSKMVDATMAAPDVPVLVSAFGRTEARLDGIITLLWRSVPNAHGYKVVYGTSPDNLSSEFDAGNVSGVRLMKLAKNQKYYIKIKAYNGIGESDLSNMLTETTFHQRPVSPHQVRVSENKSNGDLTIKWENSLSYHHNANLNIYRSEDPYIGYELVAQNVSGTSYIDQNGLAPGRYFYTVKAENSVEESFYPSNKSTIWKTVNSVNISNNQLLNLKIYPNPASEYIHVSAVEPITKITLFDLSGQLIISETGNINRINIKGIKSGSYIISVQTANNIFNQRVVIL
jgi:hypothetical protein